MAGAGGKELIDLLLAIPGMSEPDFRRSAYEEVPSAVMEQVSMNSRARLELLDVIHTFADYPHLAPWQSLLDRLRELLPQHPAVGDLAAGLASRGLAA